LIPSTVWGSITTVILHIRKLKFRDFKQLAEDKGLPRTQSSIIPQNCPEGKALQMGYVRVFANF
jgi:hypothetical protein